MDTGSRLSVPPIRQDGLQLDEHRGRQRRYWRIQRVAWWTFGAIMMLAVLGMTGSGGLFQTQQIEFANATVEVPRVSRWEGSDDLAITFRNSADRHQVILTQPFFDRFMVDRIQPEPERNLLLAGAQALSFPAGGDGPHQVKIDMRAMHFGWTAFDMTIEGETRRINLVVLP